MIRKTELVILGLCIVAGLWLWYGGRAAPAPSFHISMYYYDNQDFFADSLRPFATTTPLRPAPRVFITNQHILAASLIAQEFALAADPGVTRVFLLTQNNWDAGTEPVITSREDWKTPLGDIPVDAYTVDDLVNKKLASVDEELFEHEHGITGVVPYIAKFFPHAVIIPLVIRDGTSDAIVDALAAQIRADADAHTVVVGTIDMSHYLPRPIADAHDRFTLQTIQGFDYASLPKLDIDTAPTLRAVLKIAQSWGENQFVETAHANSADIIGDPSLTSTTSYITGYFAKGASVVPSTISVLFTGDVMLDRGVAAHAQKYDPDVLFADIKRLFLGEDITVGNLEGTVTTNESIASKDNSILRFTFDPALVRQVVPPLYDVVTLANNHTLDFGPDGLAQTRAYLASDGVLSFGSPSNSEDLSTAVDVRGRRICFVGYEAFINPAVAPIADEIKNIRASCYRVVVFAHWGIEYNAGVSASQREAGQAFIDAGADVVIGAHPHVVEPVEIYDGKAIFYSLGNFLFDQDFSFSTMHGLAVNVEFSDQSTTFTVMPTDLATAQVSPAGMPESGLVLDALVDNRLPADVAHDLLTSSSFTLPQ